MSGFGSLSDFLTAQMWPLIILGGFLALVFLTLFFSGINRHRRMTSERRGENVDSFVLFLAAYGFDPEIARTTYEYLANEEDVAFPIRHTDRLDDDLRVSEEEAGRMVTHLLTAFGREALPGMKRMPLVTVEDVLRFVQACPLVKASGEHRAASGMYLAASGPYQTITRKFRGTGASGVSRTAQTAAHGGSQSAG